MPTSKGKAKPSKKIDLRNGYELFIRGDSKLLTPRTFDTVEDGVIAGSYSLEGEVEIVIHHRRTERNRDTEGSE